MTMNKTTKSRLKRIEKKVKNETKTILNDKYHTLHSQVLERFEEKDLDILINDFCHDIEATMKVYEKYCDDIELRQLKEHFENERQNIIENTTKKDLKSWLYYLEDDKINEIYNLIKSGNIEDGYRLRKKCLEDYLDSLTDEQLDNALSELVSRKIL